MALILEHLHSISYGSAVPLRTALQNMGWSLKWFVWVIAYK